MTRGMGLAGALVLMAAVTVTSAAGAAACPQAEDIARGVRLTLTDGETEVFRATSEVLVESRLSQGADTATRFTYARGVYLLESIDVTAAGPLPDTRSTFALPVLPAETPEPLPGHGWGVRMVATYSGELVTEMLGIRFGTEEEVVIGDCRYTAVPVEQRIYEDGELVARETRSYLPELGFSYAVAWYEDDNVDRYEYVSIEAVD
ncbi:hypothetical protein FHY55_06165 [Oceanicola sp. D3]|uniref:hypothetical protein n=1 Tax=Oceanicola sp. D3 TaxID=2587163 RepID=UPI001124C588|nr:hypothetical protein [Oceanicola sp. D3]QDC08850.1 hypothetical protein FHY55_06165 [Oceanicola sp. D3]